MKRYLPFLFILAFATQGLCQRDIGDGSQASWKDRVYVGGGAGFSGGTDTYGNKYFYIGLYPIVGYMLTQQMSTGLSLTWQHYDYTDIGVAYDQYGGAPYLRYNFGQAFMYGEYMILNSPSTDNTTRRTYNRGLIGIGFSQPVGKRGAINVMGLYDVLYKSTD